MEKLHDRARAAEARASIREEITRNLGYMNVREASEACMARRLDEVDGLIAASAAGKLPQDALWIGQPINFIMLDGKYKAATQSGAVSLFGDGEQAAYSSLYALFVTYWEQSQGEMHHIGRFARAGKASASLARPGLAVAQRRAAGARCPLCHRAPALGRPA